MLKFRRKEEKRPFRCRPVRRSLSAWREARPGPGERRLYRALRESVPIIDGH